MFVVRSTDEEDISFPSVQEARLHLYETLIIEGNIYITYDGDTLSYINHRAVRVGASIEKES